jgi:citrate lyase beta subunit
VVAATYLFVPAYETRKVRRALESGSDAVILDLEDGVPETRKDAARQAVAAVPGMQPVPEIWVRINADAALFAADLEGIDWTTVTGAVLPKAESAEAVERAEAAGAREIVLLIESVAGLDALPALAGASARVRRCAFGTIDFAIDVGLPATIDVDDSELIAHVRAQVVLASRAAGLLPPIDGICARLDDDDGLRAACWRAQRLGYGAKLLIHPRQIGIAADVFRPSAQDLLRARAILDAYEQVLREGRGAVALDGVMVDRPIAERARALIARWGDESRTS